MHCYPSRSVQRKLGRAFTLATIVSVGLFSIVGTGGNGNGGSHGKLEFSSSSYSGNEDSGAITVSVTRTGGSDGAVSIDLSDAATGSATSGSDYTAIPTSTLSWANADSGTKTFDLLVTADGAVEPDETVNLILDNVIGGATVGVASTTVTILNDDTIGNPGTLQFDSSSYSGNEDAGAITVRVTRIGGSSGAATVDVSDASSGSATSGADYSAITTTTLSWVDGESSFKTFSVAVQSDATIEPDETVVLALDNATGATLGATTTTTVTILNDDALNSGSLQFSLSNYSIAEGAGDASITVIRTGGSAGTVGVTYATSDGTAKVVDGDYTAVSSTLTWNDGDSSAQTFLVPIIDDTAVEVFETVNLILSNPTGGATLGVRNTATLTISSEDTFGIIRFSSTSYSVNEADGSVGDRISLSRVNGSSGAVSVDVSDAGSGSAAGAGVDYTFTSPTRVSWADGDTGEKFVTLALVDDADPEVTETVDLSLGNVIGGATIGTPDMVTVNIADNDTVPVAGELQFDSVAYVVAENAVSATITVNRINGSLGIVGVNYTTSNGSATAGSDYTAASAALSWADGVSGAQTFTVVVNNDTDVEGDETVNIALSNPTNGATLGTPSTATLTIQDDDTNLSMTIGDGTFWVAFQDGSSGSWTEWSPTSGNVYNFPVTDGAGRYGVAFHQQETDGVNTVEKTYVIHSTVAELASLNVFQNLKYTVTGTLSNSTGSNDSAFAGMYVREDGGEPITLPYSYTLSRVPVGIRDLAAFEWDSVDWLSGGKGVIRRNINITGDLANQNVDFTNDADVESTVFTPNNFFGSSSDQQLEVYFSTNNGTSFNIAADTYDGVTAIVYPYIANASMSQAGDSYSFQVYKDLATGDSKYRIRNQSAGTDPGTQTIGLGSLASLNIGAFSTSQITGLSYTPNPASFSGAPVFRGFQIDLDQTVAGVSGGAHWQIKISKGWLGASTSYTFPSFSGVAGFNVGWDMSAGVSTDATVSTATTNNGTSLSLIIRKTIGPNSNNLDPGSLVVAKKLAHNNSLKLDIAHQYFVAIW